MNLEYHLLDVFTEAPFGGNPLAVFPGAPALTDSLMQRLARELNLSETVFVRPADDPKAACRLRIYTPGRELPFAGHPTLGTALLLVELGLVPGGGALTSFFVEEAVGLVPVTVRREAGRPPFLQLTAAQLPERGPPPPAPAALAAVLGLAEGDILTGGDRPETVSSGVPFLLVPVRDRAALGRVEVDLGRWRELLAETWAPHVFVFCREPERSDADLSARMFAPAMGIAEDPATGAAAAALAGYLAWRDERNGTLRWTIEQGVEMGRPSLIAIEAEKAGGEVRAVRVGGSAVRIGQGVIQVAEGREG